jgi:hypothetical protein
LHGVVDARGRFSGPEIMFVYPDLHRCLVGTFSNDRLVSAKASKVAAVAFDKVPILQNSIWVEIFFGQKY